MSAHVANLHLADREGVPDALYRSIIGLDTADQTMFESAWDKDASFSYDDTFLEGRDAIIANTFAMVGQGCDTTHMVNNVRVDLKEGATTARLTAHALAQHYRKGTGRNPQAGRFLTGNMYAIDMVKDSSDGLWKIKKFVMTIIWNEGDVGVFGGQQ